MSHVVLGCDINDGNDSEWQNTVASALEKNGHKVEKLPIHPTPFGQYSYGEAGYNPKGKIGVYIMADSLVSVADLAYGGTGFKYAYFIIRMDLGRPKMSQPEHFKTSPIGMDGDCTGICEKLVGKTYSQMNDLTKSKCQCTWGRNPKEGANNLIKLMGGKTDDDNLSKKVSQGGTIKDALQKLLTHWDGQVECYIRGDEVHVNKIRTPEKYYSCILQEGYNIFVESVTVTDVNPNTPNYLEVVWTGGVITIKDDSLIKRFGVVRVNVVAAKTTDEKTTGAGGDDWDTTPGRTGRRTIDQIMDTSSTDSTSNEGSSSDDSDSSSDSSSSSDSKKKKDDDENIVIVDVIDNYDDAYSYAQMYWTKLQRENGRTLECQVWGSCNYNSGEWAKVYLPSFDINGFMYITNMSQSNDGGDWTCTLTLMDFPPGWGKEEKEEKEEDEKEDKEDDDSEDISSSGDDSDSSTNSSSSSSSTS